MIPFSQPTKVIETSATRGIFEIEALYPGYGVTVGNSLRRVLLSSLEGAAATQVKIKNVPHEFSTMPGIIEDTIQLLLNIKQLRVKLHGEEPQTITLKVKGEKEAKASDFEIPSQVEIMNKDLHIATITDKSTELEIEVRIEKGMGYVSAETLKKDKNEIGSISLDAAFNPVKKVNYRVENMRVGERTDYDKIQFEIITDGSIAPENALYQAARILAGQFDTVTGGLSGVEALPVASGEEFEYAVKNEDAGKKPKKAGKSKAKKKE